MMLFLECTHLAKDINLVSQLEAHYNTLQAENVSTPNQG